jgi:hypothetical protein
LVIACKKTEVECTCQYTTRKACENEKSCEWLLVTNQSISQGTYQSILTTTTKEECRCKDNTIYEPLMVKRIVLTSTGLDSPQSLGSIADNEFTFAVIQTKNNEIPVLISSAAADLIGGDNRSSTYTYFNFIGLNTDTYNSAKTSKSISKSNVEKKVENAIVELKTGAVIVFESGNGIKGIIKVNDIDLNTNPKTLEIMVKYYDSKEQFEAPANKGFNRILRNVTITTNPNNSSFFNLSNLNNSLVGSELCFAAVSDKEVYGMPCILISPTNRSKYFGPTSNGDISTKFHWLDEDFETTYIVETRHMAPGSEQIKIERNLSRQIYFSSSNGRKGLIKINEVALHHLSEYQVNFDIKYTE